MIYSMVNCYAHFYVSFSGKEPFMYSSAYVWAKVLGNMEYAADRRRSSRRGLTMRRFVELTDTKPRVYILPSVVPEGHHSAPLHRLHQGRDARRIPRWKSSWTVIDDDRDRRPTVRKSAKSPTLWNSIRSLHSTTLSSAPPTASRTRRPSPWPTHRRRPITRCSSTAPSGLGKTHLLYAIASEIHKTAPRATTSSTSRATSLRTS